MELELQLIRLYQWVCRVYDKHPMLKYQRLSNNTSEPLFTDQELVTVYLFLKAHQEIALAFTRSNSELSGLGRTLRV